MAWTTLADALKRAIAQGMIDGDGGVGAPPVSRKLPKRTASTKPAAKFNRETRQTEGETTLRNPANRITPPIGRHRRAGETPHLVEHSPVPAARRCMLTVIEGGRTEAGGDTSALPFARAPGDKRASKLVLVRSHAAPLSITD